LLYFTIVKTIQILVLMFFSWQAAGDITNVIDIAALAACGTGITNGWTLVGIDSYADKTSIRLSEQGDYLISPRFEYRVKEIVLKVKSSETPNRKLTFFPYLDGDYSALGAMSCEYSANKDTYVSQTLTFNENHRSRRFRIAFDNPKNGTTGWGIAYLAVITEDSPRLCSPEDINIDHLHSNHARIRWEHNEAVSSYLVKISSVSQIPESYSVITNYDFDDCINNGTSDTQDRSNDLHAKYPEFTAEKIYYPAQSRGVIRVSTTDINGRITHNGLTNYNDTTVEIVAKRHTSNDKISRISVYYVDTRQSTNEIGSIAISDDFNVGHVSLIGIPDNTPITIGNIDGFKSNRKFVVDRISFLKDYKPARTVTNSIPAELAYGTDCCYVSGLTRLSTYIATITAIDDKGNQAPPSIPIPFTTTEKDSGYLIILR